LSNAVAAKFGIPHQSPQVLLIKNEEVIYDDSHYSITIEAIKKAI
jgi:bacillithiol system protein YtxJ